MDANISFEMTDQMDMLTRRLEWMAANALQAGTVTIKGEGFPTVVVDYGRSPTLTIALTGTAQWTSANVAAGNASPTQNIEAWQRQILKESGAKVTDIIFTTSSWEGFIADPLLKGAIYYPKLGESGNVIDPGAKIDRGGVFKGRWGQYDLWIYNEWYVDMGTEGGNIDQEYPMLTDGSVIMSGPDMEGTRAFASIMDPAFNYGALPFAPKMWVKEDPAQMLLMMQSAPIVIPSRVNAALGANVCPAVYT
jgi:hypothetical protein